MYDVPSLPPAARFALIIEGMCRAVASRGPVRGIGGLPSPLLWLIYTRLRRIIARFTRYATTPPSPPRKRPPAKRPPRPAPPLSLPRGRSWLMILIPETAGYASQLQHFLTQPDVQSLLKDTPQLRRMFRPLCRMLHLHTHPDTFHPIPPPRRKPPPAPRIPFQPPPPSPAATLLAKWLARAARSQARPSQATPSPAPPRPFRPPPLKPA